MNGYEPGDEFQCLSIPIQVIKETRTDSLTGRENLYIGLTICGGIDQDHKQSPNNYTEAGVYISRVEVNGPAFKAGLKAGDRILQCNGHDFTLVTHRKAVEYLSKYSILDMLIVRKDDCINV